MSSWYYIPLFIHCFNFFFFIFFKAIDGGWGSWQAWSVCAGSPTKTTSRKRTCDNPAPSAAVQAMSGVPARPAGRMCPGVDPGKNEQTVTKNCPGGKLFYHKCSCYDVIFPKM